MALKQPPISKYLIFFSIVWTINVIFSLTWNIYECFHDARNLAIEEARININKDQAIRAWLSFHGGVYVKTDGALSENHQNFGPKNPSITDLTGQEYRQLNPANALIEIQEQQAQLYGTKTKLTSLKPINPLNSADEWEKAALLKFEKGEKEVIEFVSINKNSVLRSMKPFIVEQSCLECHSHQEYKLGDIRGGISVTIPMDFHYQVSKEKAKTLFFSHLSIWLLGLFILFFLDHRYTKLSRIKVKTDEELITMKDQAETLLKELYHRTKNNMQVIVSMLRLQSLKEENRPFESVLKSTQDRIISMALVHQKLYEAKDLSHIDLKDYVSDLINLLLAGYKNIITQIHVKLDLQSVSVLIDTAIPCGILLNELFSNSIRHAFPDNRKGEIFVSLKKSMDDIIELNITDDGIGLPQEFNFRRDGQIGIQNIIAIVEHQLSGEITFVNNKGVNCTIKFKDNQYKKRV